MKAAKLIALIMSAAMLTAAAGAPQSAASLSIAAEAASKLPAPKISGKSASENSVTLKWKKVSGADAYRVFMYDAEKKKYVPCKDVTAPKCTVKGLSPDTKYKFRIAALVKRNGKYLVQKKSSKITVTTASAAVSGLTVTSADLSGGVWDTVITHTANGADRSPELSWNAVDGAGEYAVYMLDASAKNWLHWRVSGLTSTHLSAGSASAPDLGGAAKNEYIGPYPPSGTHTYVITVFALKAPADSCPGSFNAAGDSIDSIRKALDVSGGKSGNVITFSSVSGTYTDFP